MLETRGVYAVDLEIRQDGERPTIAGRFPYGGLATIAASGRRRRERFSPGAFAPALDREAQEINFLLGHDMARPLASRNAGTFTLEDTPEALTFEAVLPPEGEQTTWQRDFLLAHGQGLLRGVSPGFNVLPKVRFPNAEVDEPEPGHPGLFIRTINLAALGEFSAVARPAYRDATLEARDDESRPYWQLDREALRWL